MAKSRYSKEMFEFIRDNQFGITRQELADRFNTKFGTNATVRQLRSFCSYHKLKNGMTGQFNKGHKPWCVGLAGTGLVKTPPMAFKQGHTLRKREPIGYEYINHRGVICVKIGEGRYKHKHIMVYEQHKGAIPDGYRLKFVDGNKQNCNIDNLELVPLRVAITAKLTDNPKLNKAILLNEHIKWHLNRLEGG